MEFKFSKHAIEEMGNRNISISLAMHVLSNPQQIIPNGDDLLVYQSIIDESEGKFLIRVFVAIDKTPNVVVTLYKTSKINKYWIYEG